MRGDEIEFKEPILPKGTPFPMPPWILERFPPNPRAAVDYFRRSVDAGMLQEIAEADYAQGVEKHLQALRPIWSGANLTELDSWYPREVLELIRWSEPGDPEWKPGATGLRGHRMRAFSCAVLLAAPNLENDQATLIQLVDSGFVLGPDAQKAIASFLTWKVGTLDRENDRPFFAFALASLLQALEPKLPIAKEQELADWLQQEEAAERSHQAKKDKSCQTSPWLVGLSPNGQRNTRWESLLQKVGQTSGSRPLGVMLAKHQPQ